MKTMGLTELALVAPRSFPSDEATARASGACDVLESASVHSCLGDAIADCGFVVGASARLRSVHCPVVDPRACAELIWQRLPRSKVAVVMGPEKTGLTNEQLACCERLVHIPANEDYASLNVAMALQVLCYELRMNAIDGPGPVSEKREAPLATARELEGFHRHLEGLLERAGFFDPNHPRRLKLKLRRLFHRAQLDQNEINILRGALAALDHRKAARRIRP
jgi:tRNA (cytidine32/uridine32-2'-O)-methyltransferase